jgi:UDP-N-acetylmuramoyl-tripeptide--D-alanyl-D-alanine ligase
MKAITVSQITHATQGQLISGAPEVTVDRVSTDTRTLGQGSLFVALKGERFDAHDFVPQAVAAGASAVLVDRVDESWKGLGTALIQTDDSLAGLQRLAYWYRRQLDLPVVGITGSNGKTSTKDFTTAVLSEKFKVCATRGNLNNHIGLPLSVLSLEADDTAAVFEMGMNHPGEIAPLCEIAAPRYGIITNIGTAHIEYMGSREAIAEEKGALARSLPQDGVLFVPAGCDFYEYFRQRTKARVIPVGNGRGLIRAENIAQVDGSAQFDLIIENLHAARVTLPVAGRHMVTNALLAAGIGWSLGMTGEEIGRGLSSTRLTSGRLRRFISSGVVVFDDTYNANPESMAAGLETLAETPVESGARKFAVLGKMGEQGIHAAEAHLKVGRLAAEKGLQLIAVGAGAEGIAEGGGAPFFESQADAAQWLRERVRPQDIVLFKASRSAAIERVMNLAFPQDS